MVFGQGGDDTVTGGAHNDLVIGGTGADEIYGEGGNDWLVADDDATTADGSADYLEDTSGINTFDYTDIIDNPAFFGPNDTLRPH